MRVAGDGRVDAGDAEAAFFVLLLSVAGAEHRVDEHALRFLGLAVALDVRDEQPVGQIDLVGGQADALVLVHQLEHLGDDLAQLGIDPLERLRGVPQRRMGIVDDLKAQWSLRR